VAGTVQQEMKLESQVLRDYANRHLDFTSLPRHLRRRGGWFNQQVGGNSMSKPFTEVPLPREKPLCTDFATATAAGLRPEMPSKARFGETPSHAPRGAPLAVSQGKTGAVGASRSTFRAGCCRPLRNRGMWKGPAQRRSALSDRRASAPQWQWRRRRR
jgi:hypothetical protein